MKRLGEKKFFSLLIIGLFLFGFALQVVSAAVTDTVSDAFSGFFSSWVEGDIGANVAKILFFVLLSFFIFALLDTIGISKNKGVNGILAALIAFLSTAYILPSEIYAILVSYSALGLTLASLIPLIVLSGFTFAAIKDNNPTFVLLQWVAWALYGLFMIYKSAMVFIFDKGESISVVVMAILLGTTLASGMMFVFNKTLFKIIAERYVEAENEASGRVFDSASNAVKNLDKLNKDVWKGK